MFAYFIVYRSMVISIRFSLTLQLNCAYIIHEIAFFALLIISSKFTRTFTHNKLNRAWIECIIQAMYWRSKKICQVWPFSGVIMICCFNTVCSCNNWDTFLSISRNIQQKTCPRGRGIVLFCEFKLWSSSVWVSAMLHAIVCYIGPR